MSDRNVASAVPSRADTEARPRAWSATRRNAALLALLSATVVAIAGAAAGRSGMFVLAAGVYLGVAAMAIRAPAWIAPQLVLGAGLAAALLIQPSGPGVVLVAGLLAAVVVATELLAVTARLDRPAPGETRLDPREFVAAGAMAAGVFLLVALATLLPGPTGLLPVGVAAGACLLLALLLVRLVERP